jgi:hypothetical protein
MKQILFTFDYELYLGKRSGSVSKCMIEPAGKLMGLFGRKKLKMIFFVDTAYLLKLTEAAAFHDKAKEDLKRVKAQVKEMVQRGHYVFPHLHPHWLDAKYLPEINQWDLSNVNRYRFHNLNKEERKKLFASCMSFLSDLIHPYDPDYKLNGYRAGGWSIQPFDDFKPFFEKHGIQYDFSVLPGIHCVSSAQCFDFRTEEKLPDHYSFEKDLIVPEQGPFREFAISTIPQSGYVIDILERIRMKMMPRKIIASVGDGYSAVQELLSDSGTNTPIIESGGREMASFDLLTSSKFQRYLDFIRENDYIQFISHPKMLSLHNFTNMEAFLEDICANYSVESDFKKMLPV